MAGNKKRTKRYRPKPVSQIGGMGAIAAHMEAAEMFDPMSGDQTTDLGVAYRMAFEQMLTGDACEEHWSTVVCSLNIAMVLAERGLGDEYLPRINDALEGAFRAKLRASRTGGTWRFDGEAIQAIKFAFEVHEEQLRLAAKHEVIGALHEVRRRVDIGHVIEAVAA